MKKKYTLEVKAGDYDFHTNIPTFEIIESLCKYYIEEENVEPEDLHIKESYSYNDYKISVDGTRHGEGSVRLLKIAQDLKMGTDTIVQILETIHIFIDNKPTAKLSHGEYSKLQDELVKREFIANMENNLDS